MIASWLQTLLSVAAGSAVTGVPVYVSERNANRRFVLELQNRANQVEANSLKMSLEPMARAISIMSYVIDSEFEETGETNEAKFKRLSTLNGESSGALVASMGLILIEPRATGFQHIYLSATQIWNEYVKERQQPGYSGIDDPAYATKREAISKLSKEFQSQSRRLVGDLRRPQTNGKPQDAKGIES